MRVGVLMRRSPQREADLVFVPRRLVEPSSVDELRGPLPLVLAVVAMIGWALAAYLASQVMHMQSKGYDALGRPGNAELIQGCGPTPR